MTLYIVPCGVSIRDGLLRGRDAPPDANRDNLWDDSVSWAASARSSPDSDVAAMWLSGFTDPLTDALLPHWCPTVSAETSTLASRVTELSTLLADDHTVVILASDTDVGVAAAMLVASYLGGETNTLRYRTVPTDLTIGHWAQEFKQGTVTVARITGLDPRRPSGLSNATAGIGRVLRAAFDASTRIEVHLTGGLKATLLHTLAMTEVLSSLPEADVSAWYLFNDDSDDSEPVRIDLRSFSAQLDGLREELCSVRDGNPTSRRMFYGSGWTEQDGKRTLTSFGYGFLAVLGERLRLSHDGLR